MDIKTNKQTVKKYAIFVLMGIAFAGSLWMIFSPSDADIQKDQKGIGFNADLPQPKKDEIIADKMDAYQQEQMDNKKVEKMRSLEDLTDMLGSGGESGQEPEADNVSALVGKTEPASKNPRAAIHSSASAYQDINRTLGNFHTSNQPDPEKERLAKELEEVKSQLEDNNNRKNSMDQQVALMEKSYQLAAKYMPGSSGEADPSGIGAEEMKNRITKSSSTNGKKTNLTAVKQKQHAIVSSLTQYLDDEDLFRQYDSERNFQFNSLQNEPVTNFQKNTIRACIYNDQTVSDGQIIRLRLLETVEAGITIIPKNTLITGIVKVQGERLEILVSNIEYEDYIIRTELVGYDVDGQQGISIPGSMELNSLKEILASMGGNLGTSITLSQSAGQQIASDLSKGLIQGTSQLFAKKLKQVKITLKAGHKIFLMSPDN